MKQTQQIVLLAVLISAASCGQAAATGVAAMNYPTGTVFRGCPACPEMVVIPAGSFTMGSSPEEKSWAASHGGMSRIGTKLLWALADVPGEGGYWLLHGLNTDTRFQSVKAFLAERTESRRISAAESKAWTTRETSPFNARFTIEPADGQSLFEYTVRQLHNIGDDLANGDVSAARLIASATDESAVQSWLAQELRLRMQGIASIVREEEVHGRKRPDICVHRPNVSGPISIEIKIADRYSSLAAFKRALRSQLVGQYMRDERCRHGVLVLVFTGRRSNWRSDTQSLNATDLLKELKSEAERVRAERSGISGLDVCSIRGAPSLNYSLLAEAR